LLLTIEKVARQKKVPVSDQILTVDLVGRFEVVASHLNSLNMNPWTDKAAAV
jgi:hypothetical protein